MDIDIKDDSDKHANRDITDDKMKEDFANDVKDATGIYSVEYLAVGDYFNCDIFLTSCATYDYSCGNDDGIARICISHFSSL